MTLWESHHLFFVLAPSCTERRLPVNEAISGEFAKSRLSTNDKTADNGDRQSTAHRQATNIAIVTLETGRQRANCYTNDSNEPKAIKGLNTNVKAHDVSF